MEWWTAEEYAAWLEGQKADLQSVIGTQSWTPSTGWFTWTQEMVNETIAQYEETLRKIQAGWKISKPIAEGDATIQLVYYGDTLAGSAETDRAIVSEPHEPTRDELFAEYAKFGISFDDSGKMLYQGKLVRWFADFAELVCGMV